MQRDRESEDLHLSGEDQASSTEETADREGELKLSMDDPTSSTAHEMSEEGAASKNQHTGADDTNGIEKSNLEGEANKETVGHAATAVEEEAANNDSEEKEKAAEEDVEKRADEEETEEESHIGQESQMHTTTAASVTEAVGEDEKEESRGAAGAGEDEYSDADFYEDDESSEEVSQSPDSGSQTASWPPPSAPKLQVDVPAYPPEKGNSPPASGEQSSLLYSSPEWSPMYSVGSTSVGMQNDEEYTENGTSRAAQLMRVYHSCVPNGQLMGEDLLFKLGEARCRVEGHAAWDPHKNSRLLQKLDQDRDGFVLPSEFVEFFDFALSEDEELFSRIMHAFLSTAEQRVDTHDSGMAGNDTQEQKEEQPYTDDLDHQNMALEPHDALESRSDESLGLSPEEHSEQQQQLFDFALGLHDDIAAIGAEQREHHGTDAEPAVSSKELDQLSGFRFSELLVEADTMDAEQFLSLVGLISSHHGLHTLDAFLSSLARGLVDLRRALRRHQRTEAPVSAAHIPQPMQDAVIPRPPSDPPPDEMPRRSVGYATPPVPEAESGDPLMSLWRQVTPPPRQATPLGRPRPDSARSRPTSARSRPASARSRPTSGRSARGDWAPAALGRPSQFEVDEVARVATERIEENKPSGRSTKLDMSAPGVLLEEVPSSRPAKKLLHLTFPVCIMLLVLMPEVSPQNSCRGMLALSQ